jgi:hypothetical protein
MLCDCSTESEVCVLLGLGGIKKRTYLHGIYIYISANLKRAKQRAMKRADVDRGALNPPCA